MPAVKHIVSTAIILIVGAAAVYFFMNNATRPSATACADAHMNIAAFGDSLVAGYGATPGHDFPTLLSAQLGVTVTNLGHSGDTTADALARIDQGLQAKPDVVILLLGGNDVLQRVPQTTTQQNLGTIIDTFQKADTKVVLVGVMGGFPSDPYASMYRDLAKTYKVPLVPNILSGLFGNQSLMRDEVHPNDAGYAKVAAKIAPAVEAACAAK